MKHVIIPKPMSIEFNMFGDQSLMFKDAKEQNYIVVDISYETKTSLSVSFHVKNNRFKANIMYPGFKFHKKKHTDWNFNSYTSFHFKILKHQGWEQLKSYIETILEDFVGKLPKKFECRYFYSTPLMLLLHDYKITDGIPFKEQTELFS